jgi:hypothetical protein
VRVLLDHNLPHKLRTALGPLCEHELVTTSYLGWGHLKNGELLGSAEERLAVRKLAVVVLSANN